MSPCPQFGSWIGAYHDGELPEEGCRQLAKHLVRCEHCRIELDRLERVRRRLRESVEPSRLFDAPLDSICDLNIPRRGWIIRFARGWALAAMVVILAGVTWCAATRPTPPAGPANWERLAVLYETSPGAAPAPGVAPVVDAELQFAMLLLDETFDGGGTGHN